MIKSLLLIGALTFTPVTMEDSVVETPIVEVQEDVDASLVKQEIEKILLKVLQPETVALIMSVITNLGLILTLFVRIKQAIQSGQGINEKSKTEIISIVKQLISSEISTQTKTAIEDLVKATKDSQELNKIVVKTIALGQENTPESRLAVIEMLGKLGVTEHQIAEESKNKVLTEIKEEEEHKKETIAQLDEIIKDDGTDI